MLPSKNLIIHLFLECHLLDFIPPFPPPPPSLLSFSQDGTDLSDRDLPPLSLVDAVTTHHTLTHREGGGGKGKEGEGQALKML